MMTQEEIYEWLLAQGVREPAVVMLGLRCVAGRWVDVSEHTQRRFLRDGVHETFICRVGRVGIHILGEGDTWSAAYSMAAQRLRCEA